MGSLELDRQSRQFFHESGDHVREAICTSTIGFHCLTLGYLDQARPELHAALQLLRANGDRVFEGRTLGFLSVLALWQGDEARALALVRSSLDIAVVAQARHGQLYAWIKFGDTQAALGRLDAARQAYHQACTAALEIEPGAQHNVSAGLARVALADGDAVAALAALQPVLDHAAAAGTLDETDWPRQIELTCYQALASAGDPRAADWLARAHTALMAQADALTDATLRQGFLQNVPFNREIVAAWAKRSVADKFPANPAG